MDEYKKGIAEFLSERENLEVVWGLFDAFHTKGDFIKELLSLAAPDYLKRLEEKTNNEFLRSKRKGFRVSYLSDNEYPGVVIKKDNWRYFTVAFELGIPELRSYYGISRDIETYSFLHENELIEEKASTLFD